MKNMIQANELRIGNLVEYSGIPWKITGITSPIPVKEKRFSYKYIVELYDGAGITNAPVDECKPIPITEENILKLRRVQSEDFQPLEFRMTPPGKRQTENNFWSNWMNDDYRLLLSPSYDYEKLGGRFIKIKQIKFWFCWYKSNGQWFLPIKNIRGKNQLKYIHQIQNLFFALTGEELKLTK